MEERHSNMVSEIQGERVLSEVFLLTFVTSMILFRTLLNRNLWMNPLSDVMGGWGIWETVNGEQKLTTECIENIIMMLLFTSMVIWTFQEKVGSSCKKILRYTAKLIGRGSED